jgi:protein phosphatase
VCDDETSQEATGDAFDALYYVAGKRLANRRLTVIDATNVQAHARKGLITLARKYHCLPVAIVLDVAPALCHERNRDRADRNFGRHVVLNQARQLRKSLRRLGREGFRYVYVLSKPEDVASAEIERQELWTDRREDAGPFDIVGDVHGCFDELLALLEMLGWTVEPSVVEDRATYRLRHAEDRKLVFVGDLVDRGPKIPEVLRLVMSAVAGGQARSVGWTSSIVVKLDGVVLSPASAELMCVALVFDAPARMRWCPATSGHHSHHGDRQCTGEP